MDGTVTLVADWLRTLPVWASLALLVGASLFASRVLVGAAFRLVGYLTTHTETGLDDAIFADLRLPIHVTVGLAGFYLAGLWLDLAPESGVVLQAGTLSVLGIVWGYTLLRLGDSVIEEVDKEREISDFAPIFENLWNLLVALAVVYGLLSIWKVDVTPLLASAGIVGIAVGFAARDTVANFFGSIALYADDTYTVGDYVVLDSGEAGTVIDISVRSTRLLTRDNLVVTVPNSVLNSARIVNESAPRPHRRIKVPVGVAYGSDIDEVEAILLDVAREEDLVVNHPEPAVRFRGFGDSALDYDLLCWIERPTRDARATHELNRAIYHRFDDAGIEIPFPQRTVTVREEAAVAEPAAAGADPGPEPDASPADAGQPTVDD